MKARRTTDIDHMVQELNSIAQKNKSQLVTYWLCYALYYQSISNQVLEHKEASKKQINKGIELMKELKNKGSEDYALLSQLQAFSINYAGVKTPLIAREMNKNSQKAIELDPNNIRGHVVSGMNNYFMPKMFGGGKTVEKDLKKALSLPSQKIKSEYTPSWGRQQAYEYLVSYYIENDRMQEAKSLLEKGLEEFPTNPDLQALKGEIK